MATGGLAQVEEHLETLKENWVCGMRAWFLLY